MKKKILTLIIPILLLFLVYNITTKASVPYDTRTVGPNQNLVWTQTAYIPVGIFNQDILLNSPEDIFYKNNHFYVADGKGKQIVILDEFGRYVNSIGREVLSYPTGVFVTDDEEVYVADRENKLVYKFSLEDELLMTYTRPDEPLFGRNSPYVPLKVVVDARKNVYIIGEGSTEGVIQLNYAGDFLGYFGVNTSSLSFQARLARWFLGENNDLAQNLPPSPSNISIDQKGLLYTATQNVTDSIKKLNIQGLDIFGGQIFYPEGRIMDLHISENNDIFVITEDAIIYEYDNIGNLLFSFGGKNLVDQRIGLLNDPTGVTTDNQGNLYLLDRGAGNIQVYKRTEFVDYVHLGINQYREGRYLESTKTWQKVLQMNSSFALAHSNLGKSYFKLQEYDLALESFRVANDKEGYSDAFWQIRFNWMQNYLGISLLILVGLYLIVKVIHAIDRRKNILEPTRTVKKKISDTKFISEVLLLFKMFKHPLDTFYDIKHVRKATYRSATFWLVILFIEYLIFTYYRAFIFNNTDLQNVSILFELTQIVGIALLWVFANYLVSTLTDGEGWFRDVYVGSIYSLAPIIIGLLPITIISNYFTYNEQFVYQFLIQILIIWSVILLFFMVKDIHNFTVGETIKNILITIFGIIIIALIIFIVYLLVNQLIDFVLSILREVLARARNT